MAFGKGVNENRIPNAVKAIEDYKAEVKKRLDDLKSNVDVSNAFIGSEQSVAINKYYDGLMDKVYDTFAFLDSFGATIEDVAEQYRKAQANIAEAVNLTASTQNQETKLD